MKKPIQRIPQATAEALRAAAQEARVLTVRANDAVREEIASFKKEVFNAESSSSCADTRQ